ncbi:hypothetical protein C789_713 [Microcystis aeruginosa FACHB-905 = DIANCHI905]|nr:hypothetical protein C789_713 [Microcystis aeruginosa FACHB-905 = DIANCHI905]
MSFVSLWFVPPPPLGRMYLRIHFTHQTQESQNLSSPFLPEL